MDTSVDPIIQLLTPTSKKEMWATTSYENKYCAAVAGDARSGVPDKSCRSTTSNRAASKATMMI